MVVVKVACCDMLILIIMIMASIQHSTTARAKSAECKRRCGQVEIPFPFGMNEPKCYAGEWFEIECRNSNSNSSKSGGEIARIKSIDLEVVSFEIAKNSVVIKNPIFRRNCGNNDSWPTKNLAGSPFAYSQPENRFVGVGCSMNFALLHSEEGSNISGSCNSFCNDDGYDNSHYILELGVGDLTHCYGMHCCETTLPLYLQEFSATFRGLKRRNGCGYALIMQDSAFNNQSSGGGKLKDLDGIPAVLDWEVPYKSFTFTADVDAQCSDSYIAAPQHNRRSGFKCSCMDGFHGNPYIVGGCTALPGLISKRNLEYWITVGVSSSGLGFITLLLGLLWLYKGLRKILMKKRKETFFKRNGGLLLQQRLSSGEINVDRVKLFSLKELEKATDKFNVNRILGKGGQGTVYKGMLIDGKIIAVKKFKVEGKVEEFINEFVILSQINHRNVVQLLGCCLETEIPLLVYEFIPNGNLSEYLHKQNELMTWDMRLRIAIEVAGALFYLHSAASQAIYHRDIKSTNILLDEKYKAKVADFGTSRMVSTEVTHLTTKVQGTFGYLDPEYFHTSQFTEKSDVYSFGVVLVELLTGQKPISFVSPEEAQSLASYFILCMEENRLSDIIDERVRNEGKKEHIFAVANLARRCLELNGKKRPSMQEIMLEIEGIRQLEKGSKIQENSEEHEIIITEEYPSWVVYSAASNTGSTLKRDTSTSEIMPILENYC